MRACVGSFDDDSSCGPYATFTGLHIVKEPNAPSNLRVTDTSSDVLDVLAWNEPSDTGGSAITGYKLERREIGQTGWETAVDKGPTQRTHNYNKASWSVAYEYRVRAVNSEGEGANSGVIKVAGRPNNLGDLTLTSATDRVAVTVSWSAPSDDGGKPITQYVVQWRPDSNNDWGTDGHTGETIVTSGTSVTVSAGLAPNTIYNFRYRAHNEDRSSFHHPGAGEFEARTSAGDPPAAPVLTATAHPTQNNAANLSWTVPDDGGSAITGYRWEARPVGTSTWPLSGGPSTPTGTTVVVGTLSTSDASEFRVQAINAAGNSPWSAIRTVAAPPGAPTGLAVRDVQGGQVTLEWNPPSATGGKPVTGYTYQWGRDDGGATWPNERTTTDTSVDVTGLARGTDYQFRVRARNADRSGAFTARATATTLAKPARVTGVTATGGPGSLTVTWNAVPDADSYFVGWFSADDNGSRTVAGGSTTRTVIDGLRGDTEYGVRVAAVREGAGNGAFSEIARATTGPTDAIVSATDPSPLTESNLNGARLTVDLLNASWASSLSTGQFTVSGVAGASVRAVTRETGSRATVTLDFDGDDPATDFDAGRTLRLAIAGSAHSEAEAFTATVGVAAVVEAAPARVQGVRLTPGPQRIEADWDAVPGATGYRVSWTPPGAGGLSSSAARGESTRHVIQYLAPGTDYTVTVTALKARAPDGAASAGRTARTPAFGARLSATAPSPLTEQSLNEAVLTVELEGAEWALAVPRYRFRVQGVPVWVERVERVSGARVAVVLAYAGVDFDEDATLRLTIDEETHGWRDDVVVTVPVTATDEVTPGQVRGVTARASPGLVLVEWERVAGAHGYRVQWRESSEHVWNDADTARQRTTGRSYLPVSGLAAGTSYTARVRAITVKAPAEGAWSADATATTPAGANTPATGAPVITGAARVGQTLRAGRGTMADADGVPGASGFTWQWVWVERDGVENDIAGANSDAYAVTDTDLGRRLKVRATFTDGAGNAESRTSAASAVVVGEATDPADPPPPDSGTALGVSDASASEGEAVRFTVRVSGEVPGEALELVARPSSGTGDTATAGADYATAAQTVRLAPGQRSATFAVATVRDDEAEADETFTVTLSPRPGTRLPAGVTISDATATGTIVSDDLAAHRLPLVIPADHALGLRSITRLVNRSAEAGTVRIEAYDDDGILHGPVTLSIGANEAMQFSSADLEEGNAGKGLSGGVGDGEGDWRLELESTLDLQVLGYVLTTDGFLATMHDVVPGSEAGHRVPFFNPGRNQSLASRLRVVNPGAEAAEVTIEGVDARGGAGESAVVLSLPAGAARTLSAQALESGDAEGLTGALGTGSGKWQLVVSASRPVVVMSLLASATGYLSNLSTAPEPAAGTDDAPAAHRLPLVIPAGHALGLRSITRLVNRSDTAGEVRIEAFDDAGALHGPVTLSIGANEAVQFSSADLEEGNAGKGLSGGVGDGEGDWRLDLSSTLDLRVLGYVLTTDGFLATMHDTVALVGEEHRVPFFNPGRNRSLASRLRLVNPGAEAAEVTIEGIDAQGAAGESAVVLSLPAGAARTLSASELESGDAEGLTGALGTGAGKWQLVVTADRPVVVMSLLASATGYLSNLSTVPAAEPGD